ncbi:ABC transporter permease [Bradyrhizobium sp. WSM3983]|uniref:ABC transporter permease n=1 Tax=Bradyrhizobium sp. WSM3983 TaxID=1038867 RepID=UPI00042132BE|nr:ABC transporter permease [Bradyrhizobium sp. WSM3983]
MSDFFQILVGGVVVGATYSLVAVGFSLVYQVTGVINLAQGATCVLAALLAWSLQTHLGVSALASAGWSIVATTLLSTLLGALTFVPGLTRLSNANMFMLTAGLLTLAEGLFLLIWGSQPYVVSPLFGNSPISFWALLIPSQGILILGATILVIVMLWYLLTRTLTGQALRACAENAMAARLMGINVREMAIVSFGLASAIGAIAGVAVAPTTSLEFDTGRLLTFYGFIAVAIGGVGSFPGAVAGGLLLGILQQLTTAYVSSLFSSAIALACLIVVLVLKPSGLVQPRVGRRLDVRDAARVASEFRSLDPHYARIGGAAAVVLVLSLPLFITSPSILSGLVIAGILFLALIGLDIVMGYAGQVNLGQAGFMAVGGYVTGYLVTQYDGIEPLVAIFASIVAAIAISIVLSLVTMRLRGIYLALATLSFGLLVDAFTVGLVDFTGGPSGLVGIPSFSVGSYSFDTPDQMYYLVAAIDIGVVVLLCGAINTDLGRALKAIRGDQMASEALGIDIKAMKLLALAISAALAALSGGLYAFFFHFLSPEMVGTQQSLTLVTMLVLGGEGTIVGPLLGSMIITMLPVVFQPLAIYKTFASGLLLVLCFLFLPQGLFGLLVRTLPVKTRQQLAASSRQLTEEAP